VCISKPPIEQGLENDRRVLCWLHGPEQQIPEGGTQKLEGREVGVADEA
jgi:peptide/nickel transport system ATP-binding protein